MLKKKNVAESSAFKEKLKLKSQQMEHKQKAKVKNYTAADWKLTHMLHQKISLLKKKNAAESSAFKEKLKLKSQQMEHKQKAKVKNYTAADWKLTHMLHQKI